MLWPERGDKHGPLVPLLVTLTVVTGVVDAVSYIKLGHVFVANMTGNVVFLAFAIAGAKGLSITASLTALALFFSGAFVGGRLGEHIGAHRGRLLRAAVTIEFLLVTAALVVALFGHDPVGKGTQYGLITLLAFALGVQNASSRRLGVPNLTTTVLTLTLTGVAADHPANAPTALWRGLASITAMFLGALIGALLVVKVSVVAPLVVAVGMLVLIAGVAHSLSRSRAIWTGVSG